MLGILKMMVMNEERGSFMAKWYVFNENNSVCQAENLQKHIKIEQYKANITRPTFADSKITFSSQQIEELVEFVRNQEKGLQLYNFYINI